MLTIAGRVSEKPTIGYEIANMAKDVGGLLDHLEIARANILGYSMGGAIAQEFVRQFPERVLGLVLCATMCGGPRAIYASSSVVRVLREHDGLTPEQIARRIWTITYSPDYLERHSERGTNGVRCRANLTRRFAIPASGRLFKAPEHSGPYLILTGDLTDWSHRGADSSPASSRTSLIVIRLRHV